MGWVPDTSEGWTDIGDGGSCIISTETIIDSWGGLKSSDGGSAGINKSGSW